MKSDSIKTISFPDVFRLFFVLFSLYLMRDAFFRWDGFSYYASFSEFLPSVALASVLWSVIAVLAAMLVWLLLRAFEFLFRQAGVNIRTGHLFLYVVIFLLFGAGAWYVKKLLWPDVKTVSDIKLAVFLCVAVFSVIATWLVRNRVNQIINIISERIAPLFWLFAAFVCLSIPFLTYHIWNKGENITPSQNVLSVPSQNKNSPNIILVTFDSLAAQEMSLYGFQKDTTPFIREWAKTATLFSFAEASSNFTTPAVASLMTGKRVWTHKTYHIDGMKPVKSDVESLPAVLKANGYFNMAFVVNPYASVRSLGMSRSFDIAPPASELAVSASLFGWKFGIVDKMLSRAFGDSIRLHNWIIRNDFVFGKFVNLISRNISQTTVPPDIAFNRFLDTLDSIPSQPYFAWIHIFPPHDPYLPPKPFRGQYNSASELRSYKSQETLIEASYEFLFKKTPFPEDMNVPVNLMRDYYREFIAYIDKSFEDFIFRLDTRDMKNTVIILSADHGESFEHGYFTHGGPFLYEQVTHIPLVIKQPDQTAVRVVSDRIEQIDIPLTILDLANIPSPAWMEGRSLVPLMQGEKSEQRPVFSMNFEENPSIGTQIQKGSLAVWEGDYKLIHYLDTEKSLLFNLKQDPDEKKNIFDTETVISRHLIGLIRDNLEAANQKICEQRVLITNNEPCQRK